MGTMGIGSVGLAKDRRVKRQFRWSLFVADAVGNAPGLAAAISTQRPTLTFDEGRVNHVSESVYYPTRLQYDPFTMTILDTEDTNPIYVWLSRQYETRTAAFAYFDSSNKKNAVLTLLDGAGNRLEQWIIQGLWPQQIQFGELDFASNEFVTISATFRFDRAFVAS